MSETTLQLRQKNPDETEKMAQLEEPDNDVYGYLSRQVADRLGEYIALNVSEDGGVVAGSTGVTGSGSGNYVTFETPGGGVVGFGIHLDIIEEVTGVEIERDEDGIVQNAPESISLEFDVSDEDAWEEAEQADDVDEEEVEALIAGGSDESDDEEEVEISDEELNLVAE